MPRLSALPDDLPEFFRTRDAFAAGVSNGKLAGPHVVAVHRGVRGRRDPADYRERCHALSLVLDGNWAASHESALALLGAPLPFSSDELMRRPLHVTVAAPMTPPRRRLVTGHTVDPAWMLVAPWSGIPVVHPAVALAQVSSSLPRHELVALGDYLLSGDPFAGEERQPFVARADVAAVLAAWAGKRGSASLRWAVKRMRDDVDSRPESLLRLLLEDARITGFEVHPAVTVRGRRNPLHPDLGDPGLRFGIEYLGDGHRDRGTWLKDVARLEALADAGWEIVQVTSQDVFERPDALVARIRRAVARRAAVAHR